MAETDNNNNNNSMTISNSSKPPQISEMFQKFALAFKAKTYELFADEEEENDLSLLDSAEEVITDQKVVVIKPDKPTKQTASLDTQMAHKLISSIFATVSSFEASYVQLQTAHVPFDEEGIKAADKALISHLERLSSLKKVCWDVCKGSDVGCGGLGIGSGLEAQVEENQNKLRALETVSNRLQEEIDHKDDQVLELRKKLGEIQMVNSKLSRRLNSMSCEVLLCVRVFSSVLSDACRATHRFTKILIGLMKKGGWDLNLAAGMVYLDIEYLKRGHSRYAFLSYVCLGMFRGFGLQGYGMDENGELCNGHAVDSGKKSDPLRELLEHVASNPMEIISRDSSFEFSRFCEKKYQQLIHPTMESSIFSGLDRKEVVLSSWRSLSVFYESFVNMASSIWALHKLALSFDPAVEIFQIENGVEFSMVYMEDITRGFGFPGKTKPKVGFTVVPGFKIGRTVIQSQVYLVA